MSNTARRVAGRASADWKHRRAHHNRDRNATRVREDLDATENASPLVCAHRTSGGNRSTPMRPRPVNACARATVSSVDQLSTT
jgi:hypothetical protein